MVYDGLCWKLISCGVEVAEILMTGYCFYRLVKPFMEDTQKAGKKAFWVGISYSLVLLLLYRTPPILNYFMAYGVGVFAAFIVMCRIDRRNYEQKAFVAVTFFALRCFTSAMAEILYDKLYYFMGNTDYMKLHPDLSFALYAGNQTEEARAYGLELKSALAGMTGTINSGNPVTDVILQEILNEAEKRSIPFDVDFHYPTDSNVNAFDISVILNNALQNALEHAEKSERPFMSILSYRRNNAYMIEIRNHFMGELHWDAESGLPITSKKETAGHGYGLSNIRKVAEKYSGDIEIEVKDGEFCLSILLMVGEEF